MDKGIEALIAEMKVKAEKATSGEWWSDVVECDGTYGNGDECAEGFHSYAVYDSNNQTLLDMTNSTAACIQVDCDDESHYAWDEVAERNAEYIVLARPENVLKLIAALEQAQHRNSELEVYSKTTLEFREAARDENRHLKLELRIAENRIAELESAPNGMMQLSNELAEMKRKCAELEAASVKPVKLPMPYDINVAGERVDWAKGDNFDRDEVIEAIRAAGGTVEGSE